MSGGGTSGGKAHCSARLLHCTIACLAPPSSDPEDFVELDGVAEERVAEERVVEE